MFFGGLGKIDGALTAGPTVINGNPALVVRLDGGMDGIMAIRVEDGRITGIYYVRNPEKLSRMESETLAHPALNTGTGKPGSAQPVAAAR